MFGQLGAKVTSVSSRKEEGCRAGGGETIAAAGGGGGREFRAISERKPRVEALIAGRWSASGGSTSWSGTRP
jgi:hypothetical protein